MLSEKQIQDFKVSISEAIRKWQVSGYLYGKIGDQLLYDAPCGFADRENGIPVTRDTRYCFSGLSHNLVGLCYFLLCERKVIRPGDLLSQYIPEYKHADQIKLSQMVSHTSGIPDYFYACEMLTLQADPKHQALSDQERFALECALSEREKNLETVLSLIGDRPLDFKPGANDHYSLSNIYLLAESMSRAAHKPYQELLKELVFTPLHMNAVRFESKPSALRYGAFKRKEYVRLPDIPINAAFTIDIGDILKLLEALYMRKLLSERSWKTALKSDKYGESPVFDKNNGIVAFSLQTPGGEACLYFDQERNLGFCHMTNADILVENDADGNWNHFRKELRRNISNAITYPCHPRVVPYGKNNWMATCDLRVRDDQADFVGDAKSDIAYAFTDRNHFKVYAMQEGDLVVGLLILEIIKKKNDYWIDTVLIDQQYQGRGYGKIMVGWGVEELKRQGAKKLSIGVNRFNIPAQRLYASLGFKPIQVYSGGMRMEINLE